MLATRYATENVPVDRRRGEVADRDADLLGAGLRPQPRDHRLREVDPVHSHAALRERQRDPARADAELERGAVAGQLRQEVDDGIDDGGVGLVGVPLVEPPCHALAEVVFGHAAHFRKRPRCEIVDNRRHDRQSAAA